MSHWKLRFKIPSLRIKVKIQVTVLIGWFTIEHHYYTNIRIEEQLVLMICV